MLENMLPLLKTMMENSSGNSTPPDIANLFSLFQNSQGNQAAKPSQSTNSPRDHAQTRPEQASYQNGYQAQQTKDKKHTNTQGFNMNPNGKGEYSTSQANNNPSQYATRPANENNNVYSSNQNNAESKSSNSANENTQQSQASGGPDLSAIFSMFQNNGDKSSKGMPDMASLLPLLGMMKGGNSNDPSGGMPDMASLLPLLGMMKGGNSNDPSGGLAGIMPLLQMMMQGLSKKNTAQTDAPAHSENNNKQTVYETQTVNQTTVKANMDPLNQDNDFSLFHSPFIPIAHIANSQIIYLLNLYYSDYPRMEPY